MSSETIHQVVPDNRKSGFIGIGVGVTVRVGSGVYVGGDHGAANAVLVITSETGLRYRGGSSVGSARRVLALPSSEPPFETTTMITTANTATTPTTPYTNRLGNLAM